MGRSDENMDHHKMKEHMKNMGHEKMGEGMKHMDHDKMGDDMKALTLSLKQVDLRYGQALVCLGATLNLTEEILFQGSRGNAVASPASI